MLKSTTLLFLSILLLLPMLSSAQKKEWGVAFGGANYKGDLSPHFNFKNFRPSGAVFYRYHLNSAVKWRNTLSGGYLTARDSATNNPFNIQRAMEFRSYAFDFSSVIEYYFFNFRENRKIDKYSPYVFGGVGGGVFLTDLTGPNTAESLIRPMVILPFGAGITAMFGPKINLGVEFVANKMFTDRLDGLTAGEESSKFLRGNPARNDMYYYLRFTVSYRILRVICPAPIPYY